jgi:hypothetical protein
MIQRACALADRGRRVIIAQPTRELIDNTVEAELKLRSHPPNHRVFHGGTVGESSVAKALMGLLKKSSDEGQIIFNTHALLPVVPFWPNQGDCELMIDEELPSFRHQSHRIPQNHSFITQHIDFEQVNATYGRVVVLEEEALGEIGRNKDRDALFEVIAETVRILTNPTGKLSSTSNSTRTSGPAKSRALPSTPS